ncbi:MAG TPA: T9SS type A sorting domain-containing protein [bacterium (Candidatus Stahlbacteria)]|nr:T9SS type A sorting domain-containing protein [Candidatus Stahlbacteria bacterium]
MRHLVLLCAIIAISGAGVHNHKAVEQFTPEVYENQTVISFSNGITFDTRIGEPDIPPDLRVESYDGIGYYLVQVEGPIIPSWKKEISSVGGRIVGYIPNYTLIVRADQVTIDQIRLKPFVRWVGIYQPAYKIQAELLETTGKGKVTVQVFNEEELSEVAAAVGNLGFQIANLVNNSLAKSFEATGDLSNLDKVAQIPGVLWIQLWMPAAPANNNSQWVCQTGWRSSVPGSAGWRIWNEGIRGRGLVLCTSDSGVRTTHVVYYDASYPINSPGVYPNHRKMVAYKLYAGADFGDVGSTYHGTHVSCTVAGDDSVNGGNQPYDGISKDARLYFLDIVNASGGWIPPQNLTSLHDSIYLGRGLPYNILQHSASWRWYNSSGTYLLQDATTDAACWRYKDYLNIWAAGNEGGPRRIGNPAIAKDVLTIGATGNGTSSNTIASFSSRGPTQDNRIKPNVMAPGVNLMSADGSGNNGYKSLSGTSMATPSSNGAIGLIRQYLLAGFYPSGAANPADSIKYQSSALLRAMAMVSADPNVGSYTIPSFDIGWGRIDVDSVLFFSGDLRKLIIVDDTIGVNTGQSITDSFRVTSSIPLRVSMAWTDTAAAPNANPTLINDLNLELVDPSGNYYRGNQYSGGQSQQNPSSWDNVNVEECAQINNPEVGVWRITVQGQNVVYEPQPFAYAITGDIEPAVGVQEGQTSLKEPRFRLLSSITNGDIKLEVALPSAENLEIRLFDLTGRLAERIYSGEFDAGKEIISHRSGLPNGIYFVEIKSNDHQQIEKLLILR